MLCRESHRSTLSPGPGVTVAIGSTWSRPENIDGDPESLEDGGGDYDRVHPVTHRVCLHYSTIYKSYKNLILRKVQNNGPLFYLQGFL